MLFFKFNVFENSYTREGKDLNNKVKHVFILLRDSRNGIFTCKNRRKERKIKLSNLTCEMSFLRVALPIITCSNECSYGSVFVRVQ